MAITAAAKNGSTIIKRRSGAEDSTGTAGPTAPCYHAALVTGYRHRLGYAWPVFLQPAYRLALRSLVAGKPAIVECVCCQFYDECGSVRRQFIYPLHSFHTQFDDLYIYYRMDDPMYFFNTEVGAAQDQNGNNAGAAYIFQYTGTTWAEVSKLTTGGFMPGSRLGWSVAIDDRTVVAGARESKGRENKTEAGTDIDIQGYHTPRLVDKCVPPSYDTTYR